ncbi:hypothetical protein HB779_10245 [Phyllobacterium sp. 628]|uniref:hypothetical protein n=1 Tax=Phyllobacterium sp. 628 TaxID=2718938 RepID=UPI0016624F81|nr:hypothetical protein [Phyllobacterium sp. 628]QND52248.1 hypothetical protein HB779_10245 [Phyllobacterium sp. 628]
MRKTAALLALLLVLAPSGAGAYVFATWNSNESGFWVDATNYEDRNYSCSVL